MTPHPLFTALFPLFGALFFSLFCKVSSAAAAATRPGKAVGQYPNSNAASTNPSQSSGAYYAAQYKDREGNPSDQRRYTKGSTVGPSSGGAFPRRPSTDRLKDLEYSGGGDLAGAQGGPQRSDSVSSGGGTQHHRRENRGNIR